MPQAPLRDVVRVLEEEGLRGGRVQVLILSCGCFKTCRISLDRPPPAQARCTVCFVRIQVEQDLRSQEPTELSFARSLKKRLTPASYAEKLAAVNRAPWLAPKPGRRSTS